MQKLMSFMVSSGWAKKMVVHKMLGVVDPRATCFTSWVDVGLFPVGWGSPRGFQGALMFCVDSRMNSTTVMIMLSETFIDREGK
jgi:hypothetical protein